MAETWIINEVPSPTGSAKIYNINFVSNNKSFTKIQIGVDNSNYDIWLYYTPTNAGNPVFNYRETGGQMHWSDVAYRTVTFETAPTGALLAWLEANAVKQMAYLLTYSGYTDADLDFYIDGTDVYVGSTDPARTVEASHIKLQFSDDWRTVTVNGQVVYDNFGGEYELTLVADTTISVGFDSVIEYTTAPASPYYFKHYPKGSAIGGGNIIFRHYGEEQLTDLTGTKWLLKAGLAIDGSSICSYPSKPSILYPEKVSTKTFSVTPSLKFQITCRYREYEGISTSGDLFINGESTEAFHAFYPYSHDNYGTYPIVFYGSDRTIEITGGRDATNPILIEWLQTNATRVDILPDVEEHAEWNGTDLTETTWRINNSPTAFQKPTSFDVQCDDDSTSMYFDDWAGGTWDDPADVDITVFYSLKKNPITSRYEPTTDNPTFKIISGSDVTNQVLINWLQANATLISW